MASKTVNVPSDAKQKEKDINQKLQLYGIYSAFANGKIPSNKQADIALNSALASKALSSPSSELSTEGKVLVHDLREVIEQAKLQVLVKNEGNVLQDFIYDAAHIDVSSIKAPSAPVDKEGAKQHATEAKEGFKTLGTLLVTNGQFRKLLTDATTLLRDIAGDTAQKAAGSVKPSEDQLAQMDQPAEDSVWHEKPEWSSEKMKGQMKSQYEKYKPAKPKDAAGEVVDTTKTEGQGATGGAQQAKGTVSANVPEEAKDKSRNVASRTKNYLSEKVPQERRDQTVWRMKKMIVEIQGHSDYQKAIETLLTLAENYAGHGRLMSQQGSQTVKGARTNTGLSGAETNLRTLIERAANCTSLDDLIDSINTIYRDADKDPELRGWFSSVNGFIRKCLREQGFVLQDAADQEWKKLYDQGRYLLRERYRTHTNRIVDEVKFVGQQFDEDPQNKAFAKSLEQLFKHLGQDEQGKPAFKKHLLQDLGNVIIPAMFEHVRYIPIPRIEVSDPMVDVVVENIVIEGDNLMPNVCEFGSDNYWRWGRKKISNKNDNKIMISASGIQTDMRDVSYHIKKKQGFPSITDTGVMDILLGGEGFGFKIAASTVHKKDQAHFFKIDSVSVDVRNLDIKLKKSKHRFLFAMVKPLLFRVVRPAVEKVLDKQIRESFKKADAFAYEVHTEAVRAQEAARTDTEKGKSIYAYYAEIAQKKMAEKKEKAAKAKSRDTKVQMAVTEHDSIFKDIKLPGGISTKATEFKELGEKGDRWTSPVFTIGSAGETTNLPKLPAITRKPHAATAAAGARAGAVAGVGATNGATNGYSTVQTNGSRVDGYPDGGFKNQVNQAFGANGAQAGGLKETVGTTIPGTRAPVGL